MRSITLSGLPQRMDGDLPGLKKLDDPAPVGGSCAAMGAAEIAYGGEKHCVFPEYRHEKGCAADGLVRAVELNSVENAKANDHYYLCAERAAIGAMTDKGPLTEVDARGNPVSSGGTVGGDCQSVPGCVTKKYLIALGIGTGAGLLLGMLTSKRTDVRLVLTGAGAAGGVIVRAMMGLGRA